MKKIKIQGMTCQHCMAAVTKALSSIEGIDNVSVDLESGEATFEENIPVDPRIIREKIEDEGYEII